LLTFEQASKQDRLALRTTCGALASGTRVKLVGPRGTEYLVQKRVDVVNQNNDGKEISRTNRMHHELVKGSDLVILRRRVRLSIF
jgi:hypothetical protein